MSKSLIQTANTIAQNVIAGSTVSLGGVIRRFGCNCQLNGNKIDVTGTGYYTVSGTVTLTPTAAGNITISVYEDGVQIPGALATGSVTTVGNSVTLPLETTIRRGCCCSDASSITLVASAPATVDNVSLRIEKA